jgi:two-component system chemotaxis response regulator CheB
MSGFVGTLHNIQLADIIQLCCLAGVSVCIRAENETKIGSIYIQNGKIVHAEYEKLAGVEAFFTILGWKNGKFETIDEIYAPQCTIKEPYQFLLMEAARLYDEQNQAESEGAFETGDELMNKLRVMIVDDSPLMTKILGTMIAADPDAHVVGSARNGEEALTMMKKLSPDLITMDVNMPVMDGSTALKHIMIESPCPVLIMSNLGSSSYGTVLRFLNLGAVDFMSKPVKNKNIILQQQRILKRVHMASKANLKRIKRLQSTRINKSDLPPLDESRPCRNLIIVASGVGGYLEMVQLVTALPADSKDAMIAIQSIPPPSTPTVANYLNAHSRFDVQPLVEQTPLCAGRCHIGAGGQSLQMDSSGPVVELNPLPDGAGCGPNHSNFDSFLHQAAEIYRERVILVLLSGCELGSMDGLRHIKAAGGRILAPQLEHCILSEPLQPVVEGAFITDQCAASEVGQWLRSYCR